MLTIPKEILPADFRALDLKPGDCVTDDALRSGNKGIIVELDEREKVDGFEYFCGGVFKTTQAAISLIGYCTRSDIAFVIHQHVQIYFPAKMSIDIENDFQVLDMSTGKTKSLIEEVGRLGKILREARSARLEELAFERNRYYHLLGILDADNID